MNVSVLYCSCYMYRNLWKPFFESKARYFKNDSIPFYIGTDGPLEAIRELVPGVPILHYSERANNNTNYIDRVISYLESIDTKYVIFWYDDMFLSGDVDWTAFKQAYDLMEQNPGIKLIKLSKCSVKFSGRRIATSGGAVFQLATSDDSYIMNVQPTLFDRQFLLDTMKKVNLHDNKNGPSDFETHGTTIAKQSPFLYLRSDQDIIPIFHEGGVVRSGIITPEARAFLQREGLHVPVYENNCIFDLSDQANKDTLNHQLKLELTWFNINV